MPLYDYKCAKCATTFEINHRMSETPDLSCPECGDKEIRKVLTTGGVMGSIKGGQSDLPPSPCGGGGCASGMCGLS